MVLKSFIHYLINKYLKNYIERLDYEKLKLNLRNGNVFLENLRLKPEALAHLNIPATVAAGHIEQLKVTIPWKSIHTQPTEVHISGLYLLVVPKNEMSQDLSEHYADKAKLIQQKVENLRKAALDIEKFDNKETIFLERMRLQIMRNLVVTIRNVHISYETKSATKLGHPFSFGVTLHYLELTTATHVKLTKRIKGNTHVIYRIKEINSLSIYWNTKCKSRLDMPPKDVLDELKSKVATNSYIPNDAEMNYILRPANLITESIITLRPKEHYYERSTLNFDIQIAPVSLHIDSEQVSDVLDFVKFQHYTTVYDRCREYRELLMQESLGIADLTDEQQQRVQFLEAKLDVFNLAYIRHKVEMETTRFFSTAEDPDMDQQQQQQLETNQVAANSCAQATTTTSNKRFHHRWDSWSKVKSNLSNMSNLSNLSKVLDQRKTTTTATATTAHIPNGTGSFFEDLPKFDVEIKLSKLDLNLLTPSTNTRSITNGNKSEILTRISIADARIDVKKLSLSSRVECVIDFQSVGIFGMQYDKQKPPVLVTAMSPSSSSPLVHAEFELFPESKRSDYRLLLIIEPLKIVYDAATITRIVECFGNNGIVVWPVPPKIKRRTHMEMERDWSYKKIFDMTINLKGASLLLPQGGVLRKGLPVIRIDFNDMLLRSCLDDAEDDTSLFQKIAKERRFYRKFKLELSDLRVIYSYSNRARLQLLRRTPLIDVNFYKCLYSDDANLTKWRIGVKIAMVEIQLSKKTLTKLILHLKSVPLLYSDIVATMKRINSYFILFSPDSTLTVDLSIYNCSLLMLMHPQTSIRTDFQMNMSKTRDENSTDTHAIVALNEPTMTRHIFLATKKSSRSFYRHEHIKLLYSHSLTKL